MIITLTSDFGLHDPYVGIMKGVILSRAPGVQLVDLSHQIPPQSILAGSRALATATPFFPAGTIHLAVVDPGVGSVRNLVCLLQAGQLFLAPDNGLLTPFLDDAEQAYVLQNKQFFLDPVSSTFHGRDILAPVAAALANALKPSQLGPAFPVAQLKRCHPPLPTFSASEIQGEICHIDHFGNAITNISSKHLEQLQQNPDKITIIAADTTIQGICLTYCSKQPHSAIALINSNQVLEIAVPNGNASQQLQLSFGSPIKILKNTSRSR